jgi:hypothetical protein
MTSAAAFDDLICPECGGSNFEPIAHPARAMGNHRYYSHGVRGGSEKARRNALREPAPPPVCPECRKDDFSDDANGRRTLGRHRFFAHGVRGSSPVARARTRRRLDLSQTAPTPPEDVILQIQSDLIEIKNQMAQLARVRVPDKPSSIVQTFNSIVVAPDPNTNPNYYRAMSIPDRTEAMKWYWTTVRDNGVLRSDIGSLMCECCQHPHADLAWTGQQNLVICNTCWHGVPNRCDTAKGTAFNDAEEPAGFARPIRRRKRRRPRKPTVAGVQNIRAATAQAIANIRALYAATGTVPNHHAYRLAYGVGAARLAGPDAHSYRALVASIFGSAAVAPTAQTTLARPTRPTPPTPPATRQPRSEVVAVAARHIRDQDLSKNSRRTIGTSSGLLAILGEGISSESPISLSGVTFNERGMLVGGRRIPVSSGALAAIEFDDRMTQWGTEYRARKNAKAKAITPRRANSPTTDHPTD